MSRPGHHLENIRLALGDAQAPPEFEGPERMDAFDVLAGYFVLDALIANRDRHEHNWSVLSPRLLGPPIRLAPSYDHASSCGFNLRDTVRERLLGLPEGVQGWVERGTAWRFEHVEKKALTLVEHAAAALRLASPEGAHWWGVRLRALVLEPVLGAVERSKVEGMSEAATTFAGEVLTINLRRLRDVVTECS